MFSFIFMLLLPVARHARRGYYYVTKEETEVQRRPVICLHFQAFHILSYILEGTVNYCKPVFHWESLTDIPSSPPPLLAKE